jgi:CubicO group peptidase (beta-lactamase class C family)
MSVESVVGAIARAHIELCEAQRATAIVVDAAGSVLATWGHHADPNTVFRIASMTKSFTAATVLSLRDDGVLSLDDRVASAVPELAGVIGPGPDPTPITLRHLLTMSSGLATDDPWADRHLDATDQELDGWVRAGLRFAHPTGTAFEYSNLGYALIGRVVHRITGTRLQEHVRTRFLKPLGMIHTAWAETDLTSSDVAQGMHPVDGDQEPEAPLADGVVAPMGGLWSSAADLGRWIAFLSSAFTPTPIVGALRASSRREMQQLARETPIRRTMANDGAMRIAEGGYAMGLTTFAHDRLGRVVTHSGGLPGFGSNMRWVPGGIGVAVCANVTYAPMWHASAAILDGLAVAGLASVPTPGATADLVNAAEQLAALLLHWDDALAEALFADNVAFDSPLASRRRQAEAQLGTNGAGSLVDVHCDGGAAATFAISVNGVSHRLRLELAPLAGVAIQKYDWL